MSKSISQDMAYRQSLIRYAQKNGVTKAVIRRNTNRQYICRWRKRLDGTLQSPAGPSHLPHRHPNRHTPEGMSVSSSRSRFVLPRPFWGTGNPMHLFSPCSSNIY